MSGHHRYNEEDLAYGDQYSGSRGYNEQPQYGQYGQQEGQESQDRGIIGDTFKKFRSKYDQYQGQRPSSQDPYGYGANPSSSTVGSQAPGGGSGYAGTQYQSSTQSNQPSHAGQPSYPGGPPTQQPQKKPGFADRIVGDLLGSVTSIGTDVNKIFGGSQSKPPGQGQYQYPGQQAGLQSNLQNSVASGPTSHRYNSTFAGPKPGNDVKWYVDGCSYMWAVSEALEQARQSIWILDWWLSPELYLRRPPARNEEWRVDKILQRAANRGVKVNIIVYKEVTQVLTLSSSHTKHALENLSPNIAVFRHPDHLPDAQTAHSSILSSLQGLTLDAAGASKLGSDALKGLYGITDDVILYWAHHEKLCLIDGATAFMGGLDLCYGRWDTNQHAISDAHPSDLNKIVFPGQDYNNARVMDFSDVSQPFQNKLDRTKSSRMGWSDISICLRGPCVGDLIHHFVDRWNLIYDEKYNVRKDVRYSRLPPYPEHKDNEIPVSTADQQGQTASTQGQLSGQFAQSQYTPPPWQSGQQQTLNMTQASNTLSQGGQNYGQQDVYSGSNQGQQSFPPPPPGPPPVAQGQYQQPQQAEPGAHHMAEQQYGQSHQTGPAYAAGQAASQSGNYPNQQYQQQTQGHYSAAPGQESTDLYGGGQSQSTYPHLPATQQASHFGEQQQQHQAYGPDSPATTNTNYSSQAQQKPYPQPATTPYQASQPQTQYSSQNTGTSYNQSQTNTVAPTPVCSPPPQQTQQTQQLQGQRPISPMNPSQTQMAQHQYAAYTSAPDPGLPVGSQGPAELASSQSPQYKPYHGEPTARGFDATGGYVGERGFDSDYEHEYGHDRALSSKTNRPAGQGRFDKYKDEARKFKDEGKFLGHDLREYGNRIENKLDNKMAQYSGGRVGRSAGNMSCQLVRSCTKWSNGTPTEHSVQNAYIELIQKAKHFIYIENQFFITATGDKQKPVKNMIGAALVERVVRAAREGTPFKIMVNIPSVPAFAGDLVDDGSLGTRAIMKYQYNSICRGGHSIMEEIQKAGVNPMDYIRFYNLRNYDRINVTPSMQQAQQQTGIPYDDARRQYESQLGSGYGGYGETRAPTEMSGQPPAYSQSGQYGQPGQTSQTGPYSQASQHGQYAQSGRLNQQGYNPQPSAQMNFPPPPTQPYTQSQTQQYGMQTGNYGTQQPGGYSSQQHGYGSQQTAGYNQYQQAAQAAPTVKADDWDSVSSCYMLGGRDIRTVPWSGPSEEELNAFVSEELYIHSKVMIVDDQTVVCGSANLNDRSMLGTHDSEIAMIIQDQTMVQSTMAGRPWSASRFGASLRRQLFRKHLGLIRPQDYQRPDDNSMPVGVANVYDWGSPEDHIVSDPLSDAFQSLWNSRARTNTEVYRRAFRAVPDDNVRTWSAYSEFFEYYFKKADAQAVGKDESAKNSRVEYGHVVASDFPGGVRELKELLSQVKGTVVEMPLCFLADEDIAKETFSFNALTNEIYT